jgi:glycine/D-amino acid oxidase-like deaminating enzyme
VKQTRKPDRWGAPPWRVDFRPRRRRLPREADFTVVGGGFTGLAAAAWLGRLAPGARVVVLEARRIGSGASGRTGGIALDETAAGPLPGLGNVLEGFASALETFRIRCELALPGVWEIGRGRGREDSPLVWEDAGRLRAVNAVPGGTVDPGKLLSGLARAAERAGAMILEETPMRRLRAKKPLEIETARGRLRARRVLFATNAYALELSGLAGRAQAKFTLALATAPLERAALAALGLGERQAFYTLDLPYLWGRVLGNRGVIFGSGLVDLGGAGSFAHRIPQGDSERESKGRRAAPLDVASGEPAALLARLEQRVRGLHPALGKARFVRRWGGPILFANAWRPVFIRHPGSDDAVVLGGYSGQGVALAVYLGRWAAEALLGRRELPAWGAPAG